MKTRDMARNVTGARSMTVRDVRVDVESVDPRLPHERRGNIWRPALQRPSIEHKKKSSAHRRTFLVSVLANADTHPVAHLSRRQLRLGLGIR